MVTGGMADLHHRLDRLDRRLSGPAPGSGERGSARSSIRSQIVSMIASAVIGGLIAGVLPTWFGWGLIIREILGALSPSISLLVAGARWRCDSWADGDFALYGAIPAFYLAAAGQRVAAVAGGMDPGSHRPGALLVRRFPLYRGQSSETRGVKVLA